MNEPKEIDEQRLKNAEAIYDVSGNDGKLSKKLRRIVSEHAPVIASAILKGQRVLNELELKLLLFYDKESQNGGWRSSRFIAPEEIGATTDKVFIATQVLTEAGLITVQSIDNLLQIRLTSAGEYFLLALNNKKPLDYGNFNNKNSSVSGSKNKIRDLLNELGLSDGETELKRGTLNLPDGMRQAFTHYAQEQGMPFTEFVRRLGLAAVENPEILRSPAIDEAENRVKRSLGRNRWTKDAF
ncbi:MAG: hypothetical protein AAFW83_02905 [Pseudomonadota bacterium]